MTLGFHPKYLEVQSKYLLSQGEWMGAVKIYKELISKGYNILGNQVKIAQLYEKNHFYQNSIDYYNQVLKNQTVPKKKVKTLEKIFLIYQKIV